ncbi:MAG TPA: hypothetical protein VFH78_10240 [Candidatus Thermoplasmatota archaeon]|nr:hypothetical protein [Candidatus Thermoplasmatota archaeon]
MTFRLAAAAATLMLAFAGCVTLPATQLDPQSTLLPIQLPSLDPATFLFNDPENAPHPLFGWPTLIAPAQGPNVPSFWQPIQGVPLPDAIAGVAHVVQADGVASGGGISLFGSLAIVPGYSKESYIVDISDPTAPKILSTFEPVQGAHRGSAVIAYPDGKLVAVFSTGAGFEAWDITDPTNPVPASQVEPTQGGHKLGVVPGTPYVYNAASNGGGLFADQARAVTEIYDLTDPYNPRHVQDFVNGFGCHHIYFWNSAEKQRAICAGIEFAQIWDTADPENPVVIVNVPIPHGIAGTPSASVVPVVTPFAHFSILNADGTVLIVGDELGGGGLPPGCTAGVQTPLVDASAPTGALWFYDVSTETNPRLMSWWSPGHHLDPTNAFASCTAHHGRLVPAEDRDLLAMSFYGAGVVLLDFTNPMMPKMVDQFKQQSNTWETWYYNGYLFTGDLNRGMDVLTFE